MTIPWMMNCAHSDTGWCMDCVKKMGDELAAAKADLYECPRTEFVAVGWWDGKQALFEPDVKLERGSLLFRPIKGSAKL